jgi:hypothetical protein
VGLLVCCVLVFYSSTGEVPMMAIRQGRGERRASMWSSYAPVDEIAAGAHVVFGQHHLLAGPEHEWEHLSDGICRI